MPRRMGRPGLVGTMARTAVISGTATAVSGNVARRQHQKSAAAMAEEQQQLESQAQLAEMQQQLEAQQQQPAIAPPPPPAADVGGGDDMLEKLKELAALKEAGILTDEEFAAAKAKVLG
ncbi:MAG: SHOCT domain-containing protein [Acidimicrobiia bacterium]